jgi:FMN-dependent NADH-azoreductase
MPPTFAKPQKRPRPAKRTQTGKIVLRVDSSARLDSRVSATRAIADALCAKFAAEGANVVTRDLARRPPSLLTDAWIEHAPLPRDDLYYELGDETTVEEKAEREAREMKRRELMEESDEYLVELLSADVLVIGAPLYNFSVPASLKAWIDLVVRDKRTVRDTREGPIPLLKVRSIHWSPYDRVGVVNAVP